MRLPNPSKYNPIRVTLRPRWQLFLEAVGGSCIALLLCIAGITGAMRDITEYEVLIQQNTAWYGDLFPDISNFYEDMLNMSWIYISICLVLGILISIFIISFSTMSIRLSPSGIRWRRYLIVWRCHWSEVKQVVHLKLPADSGGIITFQQKSPAWLRVSKNAWITLNDGREFEIPMNWFSPYWDRLFQQQIDPFSLIWTFWHVYQKQQGAEVPYPAKVEPSR